MLEWKLFIALLKKEVGRRNKDRLKKRMRVANHPQKRSGHKKLEIPEDTRMLAAMTLCFSSLENYSEAKCGLYSEDAEGWDCVCLKPPGLGCTEVRLICHIHLKDLLVPSVDIMGHYPEWAGGHACLWRRRKHPSGNHRRERARGEHLLFGLPL